MRYSFCLMCCLLFNIDADAQKPSIDGSALARWTKLGNNRMVSNDGKYFLFTTVNVGTGENNLVIKSVFDNWGKTYFNVGQYFYNFLISSNSRIAAFCISDSMHFLNLSTKKDLITANVSGFYIPMSKSGDWIAYNLKGKTDELILFNLVSNSKITIKSVSDFRFDNDGTLLIYKSTSNIGNSLHHKVMCLNLGNERADLVWEIISGKDKKVEINNFTFDRYGKRLAFIIKDINDQGGYSRICHYDIEKKSAHILFSDSALANDSSLSLSSFLQFSKNGRWLFINLLKPWVPRNAKQTGPKVTIWSFRDPILQPAQKELPEKKALTAVINCDGSPALRIFKEDERLLTFPDKITGDHVVLADHYIFQHSYFPTWWKWSKRPKIYLFNLVSGERFQIDDFEGKSNASIQNYTFSPGGRFLIYFDHEKSHYISCDILKKTTINISQNTPTTFEDQYSDGERACGGQIGHILGWFPNDEYFLVYDNFDIWKLDPTGTGKSMCVTSGFGKKNNIQLRSIEEEDANNEDIVYKRDDVIILTGLDIKTKQNGFFEVSISGFRQPKLLTFGPYTYYHTPTQGATRYHEFNPGIPPFKAKDRKIWILQRQSATEAPNYYYTRDFINFKPITSFRFHSNYNWIVPELLNWKNENGSSGQGILYKPEYFDSTRKYPVIFHYYRYVSDNIFQFPEPALTQGDLNVPWFVSRGYLVFLVDLNISNPNTVNKSVGEQAFNSIMSASRYISTFSYIDSNRLGLQGHSFGGLTTNYIISHTSKFAAAAEAAGVSDPVSAYLTLVPFYPHGTKEETFESIPVLEEIFGGSIWEHPDRYQDESTVMLANNITTPLLIMHNKGDEQIQWRQGVELYMALRRLGKTVWMLEYEGEGHALHNPSNAYDYTLRLNQFYDHYLKHQLPPKWMTKSMSAKLIGIDMGYDFDNSNVCSDTCPVCIHPSQNQHSN